MSAQGKRSTSEPDPQPRRHCYSYSLTLHRKKCEREGSWVACPQPRASQAAGAELHSLCIASVALCPPTLSLRRRLTFAPAAPPCMTVNTVPSHPLPCQDSRVPGVRKTWMSAAVPPVPMEGTAKTGPEPSTASVSQVN